MFWVFALSVVFATPAAAAPGELDRSFGRHGTRQLSSGEHWGSAREVIALRSGGTWVRADERIYRVERAGDSRWLRQVGSATAMGRRGGVIGLLTEDAFSRRTETGRFLGRVPAPPPAGFSAERLLPRPGGRWLMLWHRYATRLVYALGAADADGNPELGFGRDGMRLVVSNDRDRDFAVDRRGRVLIGSVVCSGRRARIRVTRLRADGTASDASWRPTLIGLRARGGCNDTYMGALSADRGGRALVSVARRDLQLVVRTRRGGGVDRRFGRRGIARVARMNVESYLPYMTAAVPFAGGYAVGVTLRRARAAVAILNRRGRVRRYGRTPLTKAYPATAAHDLVVDARGGLVLAGARFDDDAGFAIREDYGTPYPTVWRFRPR